MQLFITGIILGFLMAIPVGPIGLLCINRSLHEGYISGLMTGFGAAIADGIYGAVVVFGFSIISDFLIDHQFSIRFIGGIFLLCLGIRIWRSQSAGKLLNEMSHINLLKDFSSAFFLTLTNPVTLLAFIGVFAALGLDSLHSGHVYHAILLILGVIVGSGLWWILLSSIVIVALKDRLNINILRWIRCLSAFIVIGFGCGVVLSIL